MSRLAMCDNVAARDRVGLRGRRLLNWRRREFAQSGGLMTYGPNSSKFFRRLAAYVDKIVVGAKPNEIPIEEPTTFELVINLKSAKSIGLTVPPSVLARADEVIE
jgi:putative ABC transport system substrate-binding protein